MRDVSTSCFQEKVIDCNERYHGTSKRICIWLTTHIEDDEAGEEAEGEATNMRAGGSAEMYQNMSQGDWQVHQARWVDQQDECWEQFDAWRGQQETQANWMYDHTVREFQYLSTRDNLEP
ncbi:hypothetical protein Tco_1316248 [Tanacetum coccineum]